MLRSYIFYYYFETKIQAEYKKHSIYFFEIALHTKKSLFILHFTRKLLILLQNFTYFRSVIISRVFILYGSPALM